MNEPTAAILAYGLGKTGSESKVIVYELGGAHLMCLFSLSFLKTWLQQEILTSEGNNSIIASLITCSMPTTRKPRGMLVATNAI